MALQGNLADLPLIDLMQVLTIQRKTGILTLIQSFSQAQIAFTQSRLYSAFLWHMTLKGREVHTEGVAALHELLEWNDGQFTFELTDLLPPVENVEVPLDYLILEHYRLSDEQKRLEEETVWADLRPRLVDQPPEHGEIMLNMDELRVLLLVNGLLSIRDIAGMVQQEMLKTISVSRDLERRGLIKLPRQAQPVALTVATYQEYHHGHEFALETRPPFAILNPLLGDANTTPDLPTEIFSFIDEDEPATLIVAFKAEANYPSLDYFEASRTIQNIEKQKAPPLPPFFPPAFEMVASQPAYRPATANRPAPKAEQRGTLNWQEKTPIEETLRPKVKRSLLGSIMAKIKGL